MSLNETQNKPFTQHFKHFNFIRAKYFLKFFDMDIDEFNIVVAIRNSIERCLSEYKYWLSNAGSDCELMGRGDVGSDNYLLSFARLHENGLQYSVGSSNIEKVRILKVESLNQQLIEVFTKLKLSEYLSLLSSSELGNINNTSDIELEGAELNFMPELEGIIRNIFWLDFQIGEYSL